MDQNCEGFDQIEENKLFYTSLHSEYQALVERLLDDSLGSLGLSNEDVFQACELSRQHGRTINKEALEKLLAMNDFIQFKHMMVRRNLLLQEEVVRLYRDDLMKGKKKQISSSEEDVERQLGLKEALLLVDEEKENELDGLSDEELQAILHSNLMEMEIRYRQEALEQADLDEAIALSLSLEEERYRLAQEFKKPEAKNSRNDITIASMKETILSPHKVILENAEAKAIIPMTNSSKEVETKKESQFDALPPVHKSLKPITTMASEEKSSTSSNDNSISYTIQKAESTLVHNFKEVSKKKKEISSTLDNLEKSIDKEEIERREDYLKQQRDRLITQKKLQRDVKVKEEESTWTPPVIPNVVSKKQEVKEEDEIAIRRRQLQMAVAKQLKEDVAISEEEKLQRQQEMYINDLSLQMRKMENTRIENKLREEQLATALRKQQQLIASNIQKSAYQLQNGKDYS